MQNNNERIEKEKVLAAVVRTFFKYFTLGIIETNATDKEDMSVYEPKNVKKLMIEHYEDISRVFNQEAFYTIARMNYKEHELEQQLKAFVAAGNKTTPMELMKFACRTENLYSIMVDEYKKNFEALLCGIFNNTEYEEHDNNSADCGMMDYELAEIIINQIASKAYAEGGKL